MRFRGGAKWSLLAGFVVAMAATTGLLFVGPLQHDPRSSGFAHRTVGDPGPTRAPWLSQELIPDGPDPVVYLASIGGVPDTVIEALAEDVIAKHGTDVRVLPASPAEESALDPVRGQYVAEELLAGIVRRFPKAAPEDRSVVIGILTDDLYIRERTDWAWAFGLRGQDGYAVVSTARMGSLGEPVDPNAHSRLKKMVLRDIGVLYYNLPLNDDPLSVLYRDVLSVDDLDRMGEGFCGSDCPSRASGGKTATYGAPWRPASLIGSSPGA